MSGLGRIEVESDDVCELCGKIAELRPYGLNNERICFECGMKNKELTGARLKEYIFGDERLHLS